MMSTSAFLRRSCIRFSSVSLALLSALSEESSLMTLVPQFQKMGTSRQLCACTRESCLHGRA